MADNDNDDANVPLNKNLLKAIQTITSFDPTGSPSANRKSLEDKLIKLAVTLQMFHACQAHSKIRDPNSKGME